MKKLRILIIILLTASIPLLFASATIRVMAGTTMLYEYGFTKYEISQATGISSGDLKNVARNMANYLSLSGDSPQTTVQIDGKTTSIYNQKELDHMKDVRGLMELAFQIQLITTIILVICTVLAFRVKRIEWDTFFSGLIGGSVVSIASMLGLVAVSLAGFDRFFWIFHEISFSNTLWILDPSKNYLIMMFPSGFFNDAALFCFAAVLIEAVIVGLASWKAINRTKKIPGEPAASPTA